MRGGKPVSERGVIPRLLSAIYKRGKELEKKSEGQITVTVDMTYYEIYNDKVFDLFEPPEKRSLAGLPLREHDKKTIVVGLTEKRVASLKEFEALYDTANANRTTFATKLNASSSRSHAITGVRVTIENKTTGEARMGTLSAIDLAGSEDNRRTCNDKERMTESASINKSLFVLAQCVEAISKKQARIPYRESKMTRILSLGQNNGMTVMILNIAPTKAYHLDTLSSLNFANRAKKIEIKEVENPVVKLTQKVDPNGSELFQRPPLRPLSNSTTTLQSLKTKQGSFISTGEKPSARSLHSTGEKPLKPAGEKPQKPSKPSALRQKQSNTTLQAKSTVEIKPGDIDKIVERKVEEILAARAAAQKKGGGADAPDNDAMIKRVEQLERKLNEQSKAATKKVRKATGGGAGDDSLSSGALRMYEVDLPDAPPVPIKKGKKTFTIPKDNNGDDPFVLPDADADASLLSISSGPAIISKPAGGQKRKKAFMVFQEDGDESAAPEGSTPRTARLLAIINSEDVGQIKGLRGVGPKRAEFLAQYVKERKAASGDANTGGLGSLKDLAALPGIGAKIVEAMRVGVGEAAALPTRDAKKVCKEGNWGGAVGKGKGLLLDDEPYLPTPTRRRSRTLMSKKEVMREAVRGVVDHFEEAWA